MARRLRLGAGIDVLNDWTDTASNADVTAVADALFSIVERTVYRDYPVINDSTVATAGYRALNLTAVPVGFLLGDVLGLVLSPPATIVAVGAAMLLFGLVIWSRPVRTAA